MIMAVALEATRNRCRKLERANAANRVSRGTLNVTCSRVQRTTFVRPPNVLDRSPSFLTPLIHLST